MTSTKALGIRDFYTSISLHLKVHPSLLATRQFRFAFLDCTNRPSNLISLLGSIVVWVKLRREVVELLAHVEDYAKQLLLIRFKLFYALLQSP